MRPRGAENNIRCAQERRGAGLRLRHGDVRRLNGGRYVNAPIVVARRPLTAAACSCSAISASSAPRGQHLNRPIVASQRPATAGSSRSARPASTGRWEASTSNAPVVAIAADGQGYWLVAADGGAFTYVDAMDLGSVCGQGPPPVRRDHPQVQRVGYGLGRLERRRLPLRRRRPFGVARRETSRGPGLGHRGVPVPRSPTSRLEVAHSPAPA